MNKCKTLLGAFCSIAMTVGVAFQVQAITITFDDVVGDNAESFYYDDSGTQLSMIYIGAAAAPQQV